MSWELYLKLLILYISIYIYYYKEKLEVTIGCEMHKTKHYRSII